MGVEFAIDYESGGILQAQPVVTVGRVPPSPRHEAVGVAQELSGAGMKVQEPIRCGVNTDFLQWTRPGGLAR